MANSNRCFSLNLPGLQPCGNTRVRETGSNALENSLEGGVRQTEEGYHEGIQVHGLRLDSGIVSQQTARRLNFEPLP